MNTKKMLVPYDESNPSSGQGDFLAIVFEGTEPFLYGLRSRRLFKKGRMVYIGRDVTEADIFAKLIDSGRVVESVEKTASDLAAYVKQLAGFKVGNVVSVISKVDLPRFELIKLAEVPASDAIKLP